MKPKTFKIGQEIKLPNGDTGIIAEETEIGELRIISAQREWFYYPDDLDLGEANPKPATGDGENIPRVRRGKWIS
jgi:hypothetical protein